MKKTICSRTLFRTTLCQLVTFLCTTLCYADAFPCDVYGFTKREGKIQVVAYINSVWKDSQFVTFPSPDTDYTAFNNWKVIGYVDQECYKKIANEVQVLRTFK